MTLEELFDQDPATYPGAPDWWDPATTNEAIHDWLCEMVPIPYEDVNVGGGIVGSTIPGPQLDALRQSADDLAITTWQWLMASGGGGYWRGDRVRQMSNYLGPDGLGLFTAATVTSLNDLTERSEPRWASIGVDECPKIGTIQEARG